MDNVVLELNYTGKEFSRSETDVTRSNSAGSSRGHVMLSYQWANQNTIKKIRDNLQANGIKCWMDIDDMQGSTLNAMARAVEGAEIVLICYSKKYQDSPNCRAGLYIVWRRKITYLLWFKLQISLTLPIKKTVREQRICWSLIFFHKP